VICEACKQQGLRSTVTEGGSMSTLMHCPSFYDEDGKLHTHDSNVTTHRFRCSNGHSFSTQSRGSCWCGWGTK